MTILKARPTTYKGIGMRSRLEAGFAAWLDRHDFAWAYEPRAFASDRGQYLPDFRIDDLEWLGVGNGGAVYAEVKPAIWGTDDDLVATRRQMLVIRESEPDVTLIIVRAGGPTLIVLDDDRYPLAPGGWAYQLEDVRKPALTWLVPTGGCPLMGEFWKVG